MQAAPTPRLSGDIRTTILVDSSPYEAYEVTSLRRQS
jgi:hypothetical protein